MTMQNLSSHLQINIHECKIYIQQVFMSYYMQIKDNYLQRRFMQDESERSLSEQEYEDNTDSSSEEVEEEDNDGFEGKVFTHKFYDQVLPTLNEQTVEILHQIRWEIVLTPDWFKIFDQLQETNCTRFYLQKAQKDKPDQDRQQQLKQKQPTDQVKMKVKCSPLQCISRINFTGLTQLSLSRLRIYSIESIAFLEMPNIRQINLTKSGITLLKPLNKVNWPHLNNLDLKRNLLHKADISRAGMKLLQDFRLNIYDDDADLLVFYSQVYVKVQSQICEPQVNIKSYFREEERQEWRISQAFIQKMKSPPQND